MASGYCLDIPLTQCLADSEFEPYFNVYEQSAVSTLTATDQTVLLEKIRGRIDKLEYMPRINDKKADIPTSEKVDNLFIDEGEARILLNEANEFSRECKTAKCKSTMKMVEQMRALPPVVPLAVASMAITQGDKTIFNENVKVEHSSSTDEGPIINVQKMDTRVPNSKVKPGELSFTLEQVNEYVQCEYSDALFNDKICSEDFKTSGLQSASDCWPSVVKNISAAISQHEDAGELQMIMQDRKNYRNSKTNISTETFPIKDWKADNFLALHCLDTMTVCQKALNPELGCEIGMAVAMMKDFSRALKYDKDIKKLRGAELRQTSTFIRNMKSKPFFIDERLFTIVLDNLVRFVRRQKQREDPHYYKDHKESETDMERIMDGVYCFDSVVFMKQVPADATWKGRTNVMQKAQTAEVNKRGQMCSVRVSVEKKVVVPGEEDAYYDHFSRVSKSNPEFAMPPTPQEWINHIESNETVADGYDEYVSLMEREIAFENSFMDQACFQTKPVATSFKEKGNIRYKLQKPGSRGNLERYVADEKAHLNVHTGEYAVSYSGGFISNDVLTSGMRRKEEEVEGPRKLTDAYNRFLKREAENEGNEPMEKLDVSNYNLMRKVSDQAFKTLVSLKAMIRRAAASHNLMKSVVIKALEDIKVLINFNPFTKADAQFLDEATLECPSIANKLKAEINTMAQLYKQICEDVQRSDRWNTSSTMVNRIITKAVTLARMRLSHIHSVMNPWLGTSNSYKSSIDDTYVRCLWGLAQLSEGVVPVTWQFTLGKDDGQSSDDELPELEPMQVPTSVLKRQNAIKKKSSKEEDKKTALSESKSKQDVVVDWRADSVAKLKEQNERREKIADEIRNYVGEEYCEKVGMPEGELTFTQTRILSKVEDIIVRATDKVMKKNPGFEKEIKEFAGTFLKGNTKKWLFESSLSIPFFLQEKVELHIECLLSGKRKMVKEAMYTAEKYGLEFTDEMRRFFPSWVKFEEKIRLEKEAGVKLESVKVDVFEMAAESCPEGVFPKSEKKPGDLESSSESAGEESEEEEDASGKTEGEHQEREGEKEMEDYYNDHLEDPGPH